MFKTKKNFKNYSQVATVTNISTLLTPLTNPEIPTSKSFKSTFLICPMINWLFSYWTLSMIVPITFYPKMWPKNVRIWENPEWILKENWDFWNLALKLVWWIRTVPKMKFVAPILAAAIFVTNPRMERKNPDLCVLMRIHFWNVFMTKSSWEFALNIEVRPLLLGKRKNRFCLAEIINKCIHSNLYSMSRHQ